MCSADMEEIEEEIGRKRKREKERERKRERGIEKEGKKRKREEEEREEERMSLLRAGKTKKDQWSLFVCDDEDVSIKQLICSISAGEQA